MNRYQVLILSALILLPGAAAFAAAFGARAPIERFEFTEVLNLKGKAQIGRSKVTTWADELVMEFQLSAPTAQDAAKTVAPPSSKSSAQRHSTKAVR